MVALLRFRKAGIDSAMALLAIYVANQLSCPRRCANAATPVSSGFALRIQFGLSEQWNVFPLEVVVWLMYGPPPNDEEIDRMSWLRIFLIGSTIVIYAVTALAINEAGFNWPAVYFGDLLSLGWRSQFNTDFLIHLFLLATWIAWREGFTLKGFVYGFLSIFMGGMFGFPYLLLATYRAKGDPKLILLGVHANR